MRARERRDIAQDLERLSLAKPWLAEQDDTRNLREVYERENPVTARRPWVKEPVGCQNRWVSLVDDDKALG